MSKVMENITKVTSWFTVKIEMVFKTDLLFWQVGDQILHVNKHSFLDITHMDAVRILKVTKHMVITVKDVGKLPFAKTTIDRTKWLFPDDMSHQNRALSGR